jgi:hypothetical protein
MKMIGITEIEKSELCSEEYFQRSLILEREQSERTGHQFMLVLLDVSELLNEKWVERDLLLERIALAFNASTRYKDIKGWYLYNTLIGIIYPGFTKDDKSSAVSDLRQKMEFFLEPQEAAGIKIYTIFYSSIEETAPIFQR